MKFNKLIIIVGLIFSSSICLAQAERNVVFKNNTNKPITIQRLISDDTCMKDIGSGKVYTIQPDSTDSWKVVDSNAFPFCSGHEKITSFLINGNITLRWKHFHNDTQGGWYTKAYYNTIGKNPISLKAYCGDSGDDCSVEYTYGILDNDKDTYFYVNSIYDNKNWMSKMSDSDKLSSIVMPGSHDAGMGETHDCYPIGASRIAETQDYNIYDQAQDGTRYFDIRVDYDDGILTTYHRNEDGYGCSGQPLVDVLNQAVKFLSENKSEALILDFSHTRDCEDHKQEDITKKVNDLLNSYPYNDYLYKSVTSTNLALVPLTQIRGKIIVIMDSEYWKYTNSAQGFFSYNQLDIYNSYSNTKDVSYMQTDQLNKLSRHGGLGQSTLFLLSWTLTADAWYDTTVGLARIANSKLESGLISNIKSGLPKPNIIYLDFLTYELNRNIIDLNF